MVADDDFGHLYVCNSSSACAKERFQGVEGAKIFFSS